MVHYWVVSRDATIGKQNFTLVAASVNCSIYSWDVEFSGSLGFRAPPDGALYKSEGSWDNS